jgi:hypothetical protein
VLPSTTLVGNVGFGADATHFPSAPDDPRGRLVGEAMTFPLTHPSCVVQDRAADDFIIQSYVVQPEPSLLGQLYMGAHRTLRSIVSSLRPA